MTSSISSPDDVNNVYRQAGKIVDVGIMGKLKTYAWQSQIFSIPLAITSLYSNLKKLDSYHKSIIFAAEPENLLENDGLQSRAGEITTYGLACH